MTNFRLPTGGRIDRTSRLKFFFDQREMAGHPGDTLASALLANGVHLMGRSFKYHRPRGPIASGAEEPNALVTIGTGGRHTPNLRATQVELYEGLSAASQNRWPTLPFDVGAINGFGSSLLAAGFYYKTFMGPGRAWHRIYEPLIRRAAGLGRAPGEPDPDVYTQRYAFCDVLVIGAGAAGLAAARAAAEHGAKVMLVDEDSELGGGLLSERAAVIDGSPAFAWCEATRAALAAQSRVMTLARTTAFGYFAQNYVGLSERITDHLAIKPLGVARERLWKVRAKQVVIATGAIERPLVFGNNDRPGILLAGAVRAFVNRWAVRPGTRAVVFTADDSGYAAARDLASVGVAIATIADLRDSAGCDTSGSTVRFGTVVANTIGRHRVSGVDLVSRGGGRSERIPCDLVLMAGGWTPSLHLFSQSRGKLEFDEKRQVFLPGVPAQAQFCAGACRGVTGLAACIQDGFDAGARAAIAALGRANASKRARTSVTAETVPAGGFQGLPSGVSARMAFVDFQNDVKASDISLAVREGFRSIEHVKRYTTSGMATDQGKTSNMNALAIAAADLGRPIPAVGLTTFRMPYTPVTFGSFAGHARGMLFDPIRQTPMHDNAAALGAVFEDVGQWKRAHHFPRTGELVEHAVARECRAVRERVGMFDASTLGKIEVVGPDAAEFLNRLYTNAWTKLAPGRCRYGLMLNEAGFVMDDGVVGRLAPDRFHVTTTTSGAASVLAHMEDFLQTEFTDLRVWLTSVTEQWAVIAIQGPLSRQVIAPLIEGVDLSPDRFPHMSVAAARICGVEGRLFRVSFTGELGFEINVPSGHAPSVWEAVARSGGAHGIMAYGTEAMHVLRAEKGYIVVGQETDGTVTPDDLGLGWAVAKSKRDFVGARSLRRPDLLTSDRMQLVGLLTAAPDTLLDEGAQIVAAPDSKTAIGHITSAYRSATLGRTIALALLSGGRSRIGHVIYVPGPTGPVTATVAPPVFYDLEGARLNG